MAFLFGRGGSKSRTDLVKNIKDLVVRLQEGGDGIKRAEEEIGKSLAQLKVSLQGTYDTDSPPEVVSALVTSALSSDLLLDLAQNMHLLPFDGRKDAQTIFSFMLRYKPPGGAEVPPPCVTYIATQRPEIVQYLCLGYDHKQSAMACGVILREALKHEDVAMIIIFDESGRKVRPLRLEEVDDMKPASGNGVFWLFFGWMDRGAFEVSTDAFTTFRDILTRHKNLAAHYLDTNYNLFFSTYNNVLVKSNSYMTKRQSIKLLGEILLDKTNYNVMTAYVDEGEHLKLAMTLLRAEQKMVQYEAFHVFKVFVANPHKSMAVQKILIKNKERLLAFLPTFLDERTDDEQFSDEKSFLVRQIEHLPPEPVEPTR